MGSLYIDCSLGVSGDMLVAALLDAGADSAALDRALSSLSVADEFEIAISTVTKAGMRACDFDVVLRHGHETHDHDMAYLHGHGEDRCGRAHEHAHEDDGHHCCEHAHAHGHAHGDHDHQHEHHHEHAHGHEHRHEHHHEHRNLHDVMAIIDSAQMTQSARAIAARAFEVLAQAEAQAHGLPVDQVHFHEVGAIDSIVDIVSAAVLADSLDPDAVYATPLADGHGTIRCQHGVIPVPVPAVVNICRACELPTSHLDVEGELVTPTGAALIAALDARRAPDFSYTILATGMGAGKRGYSVPSLVRVHRIERARGSQPHVDGVIKLECDVDDQSAEGMAHAAQTLLRDGALEAHWLPVFGKKGRPAYQLQVIAAPQDAERLRRLMFLETTTIGVRWTMMDREVLERSERVEQTSLGPVRVKTVVLPDGEHRSKPEYEDVARISSREGIAFPDALVQITAEIRAGRNTDL